MSTKKSTSLTTVQAETGVKLDAGLAGGTVRCCVDTVAVATTDIDDNDIVLLNLPVPSNSIIKRVDVYTDDLDSGGPTIAFDVGLYAYEKFTSVTSGTKTVHAQNDVLDRDVIGNSKAIGQAADTAGTNYVFSTRNINTMNSKAWELLGYDSDPVTRFNVALTVETAATTPAAGDITVVVEYVVV